MKTTSGRAQREFPRLVDTEPTQMATKRKAPVERGRLWYDFEIPDRFLSGLPQITSKVRWVREHFPRATRVKVGRASAWYEADILDHLAGQEGSAA